MRPNRHLSLAAPVAAAVLAALLTASLPNPVAAAEARILRYPDIHGDQVAFVHAGDVWVASTAGGFARRLTTHEGMELFPKFSPDGRWLAFSAEYSGSRQVHVMSVAGGAPRQLTFYNDVGEMPPRGGFDYRVLDWTPDGEKILFRANRTPWGDRPGRPYLIAAAGGMEEPLPMPEGGGGMFSPDGSKLVYTPIHREFRTWKRHQGGLAQDVWIYDLTSDTAEKITDWVGTDNQPVWVGDTIYFDSDRAAGGRLNLWAYEPATREPRQVTFHEDFDVLWPSGGPDAVVYESGGYLHRFDPATGESSRLAIQVASDELAVVPAFRNVSELIGGAALSPSGKRALFDARGDLFTVPAEKGEIRNLTRSQGVRERDPSWSPDGRWIAYLSDRTGEYEVYVRPAGGGRDAPDGASEGGADRGSDRASDRSSGDDSAAEPADAGLERQVTRDSGIWLFAPRWSPDGKRLAFGDRKQRLRVVEVESGRVIDADASGTNDIMDYRWSPDSRWLVYTKVAPTQLSAIWVYSLDEERAIQLTDGRTNDYEPIFDPKGRYLYFLSDRDYNLTFSGYEFNYLYTDPTRVYAALLAEDGPALLLPRSDEEEPAADEEPDDDGKPPDETTADDPGRGKGTEGSGPAGDKAGAVEPVRIDVTGFAQRVVALPGEPGTYRSLAATGGAVLWLIGDDPDTKLEMYSLEDEETKTVLAGIEEYHPSGDGKKLLWRKGEDWGIAEVAADQKTEEKLDLAHLEMKLDPRAEWRQIFADAWRITRDWFYDPGMHGRDWNALRAQYEPWVEHVSHGADLTYILGEMGAELSAGHYYVEYGDMPRPERRDNGLLGAEIEAHESGSYRIAKIFAGENWHEDFRSPLTMPGVDVREGDFILAVDGRAASEVTNFYQLLENAAGRAVRLTVNDRPSFDGAREEVVVPAGSELGLRYLDWVESRRRRVDELSGGRIGYVHLPNTAFEGNRELQKQFFPQAAKEALIVDVRYNGGGFIPDRMIELLTRTQLSFWARRGIVPFSTPGFVLPGPKACLINGQAGSGGDAFPYYFRKLGLGPLIGTRTWGGLIGLSGNPGLADGGLVNVPTFRFYDTEGEWQVEGVGVAPDIEVEDRPDLVAKGQDPTLEKAVEALLAELEKDPPRKIEPPAPPRVEP